MSDDLFIRVGGYHCPQVTDDPKQAKTWLNSFSGDVLRVDETTTIEDINLAVVVPDE